MWRFKSCPKCKGDVFVGKDVDGWYEQCLQCGYFQDLKSILQVAEQPAKKQHKELAVAGAKKSASK